MALAPPFLDRLVAYPAVGAGGEGSLPEAGNGAAAGAVAEAVGALAEAAAALAEAVGAVGGAHEI